MVVEFLRLIFYLLEISNFRLTRGKKDFSFNNLLLIQVQCLHHILEFDLVYSLLPPSKCWRHSSEVHQGSPDVVLHRC